MKVFDKRPLSLILCIILGAFVFFSFGDKAVRLTLISICALLILVPIFISSLSKTNRFMIAFCACIIFFASLISYIYFDLWYYADKRFPERCEIEGTVESFDFTRGAKILDLSADSINDEVISAYKLRVILTDNDITNITTGTKVRFTAKLCGFESNSDFDTAAYYYSRGYSASAENVEDLTVTGYQIPSLRSKITDYRNSLARKLVLHSSEKNGGLLAALLLGSRDFLSGQVKLDFSRIGISHILAVSGMHIAILCHGLSRLLSMLGLGKNGRKISEILFALFYMALTGFAVSVMRAGLMLILSSLLFLMSSSKDSVTNLFISVTLILIIQPYSVFDISLWLSAFAALGIIIFAEFAEKTKSKSDKDIKSVLTSLFAPLLSSVFAIGATLAISHFTFNSISSLGIPATFVFSPLILVFMYMGTFFLLTASFIPMGAVVNSLGDIITDLAHKFSSAKLSLFSTNSLVTKVSIIIFTVCLFFFLVLEIRKRKTATAMITLLLVASILSAGVYSIKKASDFTFQYYEVDGKERILMKKDCDCSLLEISTPSNTVSYETLLYLKDNDILYLENYIITSYTAYTAESLEILLSGIFVENLYIPAPKASEQKETYSDLLGLKENYKVNLIPYSEGEMLKISDFTFFPIYYDNNGRFAVTLNYNNRFYTYITADMLENNTVNYALKIMNGANTVIIGTTGERTEDQDFIYKIDGDTKLIYNKKSGLPDEILKYYENRITVDPDGSLDLYVE